MKKIVFAGAALGLAGAITTPACATLWRLDWSGSVVSTRGDTSLSDIKVGDEANASFLFEDSIVWASTSYPSTSAQAFYDATLSNMALKVGSFQPQKPGGLVTLSVTNSTGDSVAFFATSRDMSYFFQFDEAGRADVLTSTSASNLPFSAFSTKLMFLSLYSRANMTYTSESIVSRMSLTVTNLSAVPEPATWAMFIGGFGLIGGTMRRKRVTVQFA